MSDSKDEATAEEFQNNLIAVVRNITDTKKLKFYIQLIIKMEEVD